MSIKQYKFVSPGVFTKEIDESQVARQPEAIGPVVIGHAERGPNLLPVTCQNYEEFFQIFGKSSPGLGNSDAWRNGSDAVPTYGSYAAQAYFKNGGPVTFVKLAGIAGTSPGQEAGWSVEQTWGLFVGNDTDSKILAAVFYTDDPNATFTQSIDDFGNITVSIGDIPNPVTRKISFDKSDQNFIRKVFNTNPTLTNTNITPDSSEQSYWLGQTFENSVIKHLGLSPKVSAHFSQLYSYADWNKEHTEPSTGWVISQIPKLEASTYQTGTLSSSTAFDALRLFRFHSLRGGEWDQKNIKISIQDIKPPSNEFTEYGTFSVVVRQASDTDARPKVLERFTNVNLDATSDNFIAKAIGDRYYEWTTENKEKKYKRLGKYDNVSSYIRVEMKTEASDHYIAKYPFGFEGPEKFKPTTDVDGTSNDVVFPTYLLRDTTDVSGENLTDRSEAYFGVTNYQHNGASLVARHAQDYGEHSYLTADPSLAGNESESAGLLMSFVFTLDDVQVGENESTYSPGAFNATDTTISDANDSFKNEVAGYTDLDQATAAYDQGKPENVSNDLWEYFTTTLNDPELGNEALVTYPGPAQEGDPQDPEKLAALKELIEAYSPALNRVSYSYNTSAEELLEVHDRFTMPLHGGFDGLDITEKNPFGNHAIDASLKNYEFLSVQRALNTVADPEVVEMNLLAVPGVSKPELTKQMVDLCENRADALAIIDIENDYKPTTESDDDESTRLPSPVQAVNGMKTRALNSSYGACFFPWVTIRDEANSKSVDVPPSVAMMGVMASSAARSELWFAPAGFTRGGLSANGAAGLPVVDVKYQLSSKERDILYENNVNPIASFPNEGIVVFGQKTLQLTQSALDRINVRRLMIYVKKEISRMAATLLFEPNVNATWSRFLASADPFLRSVQSRFGLTEYKVILDETTTTPELIDRNIMYAKIFLKPARAIEFIALDFTITSTGASFEDL